MKLDRKIVLVTGGNSGIGRAIALRAAAEGARIAISGRDLTKGARVLAELQTAGAEAAFIPATLGEEEHAANLIAAVTARFGGIDVVVNNAGSSTRYSDIEAGDGPGERLRKVMRINFDAAYHVAAHALPMLRAGGGGSIVNISSTAAVHGTWGTYGIAKAALEGLTRALAVQGAPHRIRANGVSPGWIATDVATGHDPPTQGVPNPCTGMKPTPYSSSVGCTTPRTVPFSLHTWMRFGCCCQKSRL